MRNLKVLLAAAGLLIGSAAFAQKKGKDNLSNKIYNVTVTESKKGKSGKPAKDELEFRSGKLKSNTVMDAFGFGQIKYELMTDSVYTEEGSETVYIVFEATAKDKEENEVKVSGTIDGYGIEGYMELIDKKGKVKKHFDFVGGEKGPKKAPKDSKKKKEEEGEGDE